MAISRERILDALARLPLIDAGELAIILGEPLATVHRVLTGLLQDGLAQPVSHGTACLPSSHRYYPTCQGIAAAADALGYDAPSEFVRACPVSRQWLTLLPRPLNAAVTGRQDGGIGSGGEPVIRDGASQAEKTSPSCGASSPQEADAFPR